MEDGGTAQTPWCSNCGYSFLQESMVIECAYHACPRCGHHLSPPVTIGVKRESKTSKPKEYKSIVE